MSVEDRWNNSDKENRNAMRKKPVLVSVCSSQIPQGLAWDSTQASLVTGLQLTA